MKEMTPANSTFLADQALKNVTANATKSFSQIREENSTASNASKHEDPKFLSNKEAKAASTLKLTSFAVRPNEILVRVQNLADKFDGIAFDNSSIMFNVNDYAREFYLESNTHNLSSSLLDDVKVRVTEMTLSGSIAKSAFSALGSNSS
jgi:hypothetical protein